MKIKNKSKPTARSLRKLYCTRAKRTHSTILNRYYAALPDHEIINIILWIMKGTLELYSAHKDYDNDN